MEGLGSARRTATVPSTLAEFVAPATTALILWDMQKGLAGKAVNAAAQQRAAHALIEAADKAAILVVWSRHLLPALSHTSGPFLLFLMRKQGVSRTEDLQPFMQEGMEETEFLPGFTPAPHHVVLDKSQPSLFVDTPLDLRLKAHGVKNVVISGVTTDIGVEFTARHALASGYFPIIAEDACAAYSVEAHERSLVYLRKWMVVASTAEITSVWNGR